jgi:membrane-bound serine protease (ClpP class)
MSPVVWVAALFLVGIGVIVLEVFVPSGGVLGFVSLAAIIAAIATAFLELGVGAGTAMIALSVVVVPVILGLAFRWFPETPLGRRVLPAPPEPADVVPDAPRRRRARDLVGHQGRTTSDLLPWGTVEVGSETLDGVSEGGPIDAGREIVVVAAQGAAVVVRPAPVTARPKFGPGEHGDGMERAVESEKPAAPEAPRLSPTLENFTFESFKPPDA